MWLQHMAAPSEHQIISMLAHRLETDFYDSFEREPYLDTHRRNVDRWLQKIGRKWRCDEP
jgi:hypothetical protein